MSWIFLAGLLVLTPMLTGFLRAQPKYLLHACFVTGLLLFFLNPLLYAAPISWAQWPGTVKGVEVSVLDAFSVAIILATRPVRVPLALKLGLAAYVLAFLISLTAAKQWMAAVFYGWQLLRACLLFLAVVRATAMFKNAPIAMAAGLGAGVAIEAVWVVVQYLGGQSEPGGTIGHRNLLGMMSHFAVMPAFALLLAGRRSKMAALVVLAGLVIALVGGSRATIGLYAIGLAITSALAMWQKMTGRKTAFALTAVIALALAAPAMNWALERRPSGSAVSAAYERNAMKAAARMIISDYPLGIGANQYVLVAVTGGYSARAGVAWTQTSRSAPVHNSYYLVAAELGFLGLFGMLIIFSSVLLAGLRRLRRSGSDERSQLLTGLVGALIVVCGHMAYEWLFASFYIHYLLAMTMGMLVGILVTDRQLSRSRAGARVSMTPDTLVSQHA